MDKELIKKLVGEVQAIAVKAHTDIDAKATAIVAELEKEPAA